MDIENIIVVSKSRKTERDGTEGEGVPRHRYVEEISSRMKMACNAHIVHFTTNQKKLEH